MTFKDLVLSSFDFDVRAYSGRGMYSKTCLGINTPDLMQTIAELIAAALDADDSTKTVVAVADAIKDAKTDAMGLDTILYFPHISMERKQANDALNADEV